jgi:hypothetical protein
MWSCNIYRHYRGQQNGTGTDGSLELAPTTV